MAMLLAFFACTAVIAQNITLSVSAVNSGNVFVGGTIDVNVRLNNSSPATIAPAFKLRATLFVASNVKIAASGHVLPAGWSICTQADQSIVLTNDNTTIPASQARTAIIKVQGVNANTTAVCQGNFSHGGGTNATKCSPGAPLPNANTGDDASSVTLNVLEAPACNLTATAAAPALVCGQTNTTLTVTPTGANGTVEYSLDGGAFQASNTFSVPAGGPYVVTVREKDFTSCFTTTEPVTVDPAPAEPTWYEDQDNDGFGSGNTVMACTQPAGYRPFAELTAVGDCDDNNNMVWRNVLLFVDNDGDGYTAGAQQELCIGMNIPAGFTETSDGEDCDDANDMVWRNVLLYVDADGDGHTVGAQQTYCIGMDIPAGLSETSEGEDCDDANDMVWRNVLLYVDADGDLYAGGPQQSVCIGMNIPAGYIETSLGEDCNDNNAGINPGATEICGNGIDENCNGMADDVCGGPTVWYLDFDNDGFGRSNITKLSETKPFGYVAVAGDCADWDASIYPGAPELVDGKDNDCNGQVDEGTGCTPTLWYLDFDKDGFGRDNITKMSCVKPIDYVAAGGDCNDRNPNIFPGQGCSVAVSAYEQPVMLSAKSIDAIDSKVDNKLDVSLAPNPAISTVTVKLNGFEPNKQVSLVLMSIDGRQITTRSEMTDGRGQQQVRFNVGNTPNGVYMIQAKQGILSKTVRLMVKH